MSKYEKEEGIPKAAEERRAPLPDEPIKGGKVYRKRRRDPAAKARERERWYDGGFFSYFRRRSELREKVPAHCPTCGHAGMDHTSKGWCHTCKHECDGVTIPALPPLPAGHPKDVCECSHRRAQHEKYGEKGECWQCRSGATPCPAFKLAKEHH